MRVVKSAGSWGGKGMWVLSTSALMIGVPWALAFVEEQQVLEMEREQKAREGAGEVSLGVSSGSGEGENAREKFVFCMSGVDS